MAQSLEIARTENDNYTLDQALKAGVKEYGIISSFNVETDEDKKRLFRAQNSAQPLADMDGTYIDVVDVVLTESTFENEEGEKTDNPAVILVDSEGDCYFSPSLGVYESVKTLINTFGMPSSWDAPKRVVTKTRTTRNGRTYRYLDM